MNNDWVKITIRYLQEIIETTTLYPSQYANTARILCEAIDWYIGVDDKDTWRYACSVNFALSVVIEHLKLSDNKKYFDSEIKKITNETLTVQKYANEFITKIQDEEHRSYWETAKNLTNEILDIIQKKEK